MKPCLKHEELFNELVECNDCDIYGDDWDKPLLCKGNFMSNSQKNNEVKTGKASCLCEGVEFQTYDAAVSMKTPEGKWVCIDVCIATEVGRLWLNGVKTLNSCCGHGKMRPWVIIAPGCEVWMREHGYKHVVAPSGLKAFLLDRATKALETND